MEAIKLHNSLVSYENRAFAKGRMKDYKGAISDFTKVIELNPSDNSPYSIRGFYKYKIEDYRGAIADYTKAIDLQYNKRWAVDQYFQRGRSKYNIGDYLGSIDDFTKAIEIKPLGYPSHSSKEFYYHRGLAKIKLSQKTDGCLDFSKAGKLGYEEAYQSIKKYCN